VWPVRANQDHQAVALLGRYVEPMSATVVGGDLEMKTPAKDRQSLAPRIEAEYR
jgi:hypothetical protein